MTNSSSELQWEFIFEEEREIGAMIVVPPAAIEYRLDMRGIQMAENGEGAKEIQRVTS